MSDLDVTDSVDQGHD